MINAVGNAQGMHLLHNSEASRVPNLSGLESYCAAASYQYIVPSLVLNMSLNKGLQLIF